VGAIVGKGVSVVLELLYIVSFVLKVLLLLRGCLGKLLALFVLVVLVLGLLWWFKVMML
jgi:hypothetical protein